MDVPYLSCNYPNRRITSCSTKKTTRSCCRRTPTVLSQDFSCNPVPPDIRAGRDPLERHQHLSQYKPPLTCRWLVLPQLLMIVWRGSLPALIYPGGQGYMKVLAEYSWSPTTTQSGSFLCAAASSTPIRVVTKEVRYIHELSITLEYSMPINSPAAPGLTMILTCT